MVLTYLKRLLHKLSFTELTLNCSLVTLIFHVIGEVASLKPGSTLIFTPYCLERTVPWVSLLRENKFQSVRKSAIEYICSWSSCRPYQYSNFFFDFVQMRPNRDKIVFHSSKLEETYIPWKSAFKKSFLKSSRLLELQNFAPILPGKAWIYLFSLSSYGLIVGQTALFSLISLISKAGASPSESLM